MRQTVATSKGIQMFLNKVAVFTLARGTTKRGKG